MEAVGGRDAVGEGRPGKEIGDERRFVMGALHKELCSLASQLCIYCLARDLRKPMLSSNRHVCSKREALSCFLAWCSLPAAKTYTGSV